MTNSPDERGAELRELFYETSQELLQALNEEALKLEKNPGDEEIVRSIRRTVHTLKGDSAACGLRELSELAHQFEDALSLEGTASHAAVAEIAFATADIFTEMIAAYRNNTRLPGTKNLSKRIEELTAPPAASASAATPATSASSSTRSLLRAKPARNGAAPKGSKKAGSKTATKGLKRASKTAKGKAAKTRAKASASKVAEPTTAAALTAKTSSKTSIA